MIDRVTVPQNRLERRKLRTRTALISAAQSLLAAGNQNVPVLQITQLADVGMGSFYNHFETKEQLFEAAVDNALEALGDVLDALTDHLTDPAEIFAQSVRLTGRLHRLAPKMSKVVLSAAPGQMSSDRGLAARARRDLASGIEAGRFSIPDLDLTLVVVSGAVVFLGQLLHDQPDRDDAAASDRITEDLLRFVGVPDEEARAICAQPLPDLQQLLADTAIC
ncbi:TetR/AcrR family transcriptional regulator [Nocardia cyriacigeorgica]|uniref:TetR/AcrR family transcriptional regulator n=1 Tax=Nocardia cyriacigeorgica TaxID=135487 RepID=A0A6P1CMR7_9NOCA|nr:MULTISPECIES: TetR/AcrR family transcriptional regulator [Nocardiaceae]MCR8690912.1 TetR/AcrR family transcriptional regulator [Rhodococcus pyridinivorans]AYA27095.1 TetR/AcrR family transcriptional regulator [Rhodococcus rhodochrous]MBF6215591.1 TetR/AcrR family transcriptional regulator [Nocardia puris]MBF6424187.1 TetR/AcrR family transcriptional regulator [Nocardia cyriacigeorgica]MXQ78725.1 TetR family transcriptional regulator [Rhodococcus rhodochrous]